MVSLERIRRQQLLRQAEGYLELGMPRHALDAINRIGPIDAITFHGMYLQGEALRSLGRYHEAIVSLRRSAEGSPSHVPVWLALGWCHKRVGRIDLAIEALEQALEVEPVQALVLYNLACYWSLAANKRQSIMFLARALELDSHYRAMVAAESDFDNIRLDPAFKALTSVVV